MTVFHDTTGAQGVLSIYRLGHGRNRSIISGPGGSGVFEGGGLWWRWDGYDQAVLCRAVAKVRGGGAEFLEAVPILPGDAP